MQHNTTYSKFRVHNPILTPLLSKYSINWLSPGCGSCSAIAAVSMARMEAKAVVCSAGGREWMCVRMSVVLGMERAALVGEEVGLVWV